MRPIEPPALVEVDANRRYIEVNESACNLLGYSRDELLGLRIDEISFPSGAHVSPMFQRFRNDQSMSGIFAVRTKRGDGLWIRFESYLEAGRMVARWTEYEPIPPHEIPTHS